MNIYEEIDDEVPQTPPLVSGGGDGGGGDGWCSRCEGPQQVHQCGPEVELGVHSPPLGGKVYFSLLMFSLYFLLLSSATLLLLPLLAVIDRCKRGSEQSIQGLQWGGIITLLILSLKYLK